LEWRSASFEGVLAKFEVLAARRGKLPRMPPDSDSALIYGKTFLILQNNAGMGEG